jgi:hypothetical protein
MAQYAPDILEPAMSQPLEFPPDDRLELTGGSTIEFWVQPDWTEDPGYDPTIVSNLGPEGASYLIAMTGARDGIGVISGDLGAVAPFDFADGRMHHVAVVDFGDVIQVVIDGKPVADLGLSFDALPSQGLWIGTDGPGGAPFIGAIGDMRMWNVALSPEVIGRFAKTDLTDPEGPVHPRAEWLVGISNFDDSTFILTETEQ